MENKDRGKRPALPPASATLLLRPDVATETQVFRLFDLPDELWLRIGKMVIDDEPNIYVRTIRTKDSTDDRMNERGIITLSSTLTPPSILQTCTALRKELRNEYYRNKIAVTAGIRSTVYENIGRYLRMMGPEARAQIHLVCECGQMHRLGAARSWLRPPPMQRFKDWEWEMMFTRVPPPYWPPGRREHADWEVTFL